MGLPARNDTYEDAVAAWEPPPEADGIAYTDDGDVRVTPGLLARIDRLALTAARRYARRCSWAVVDDLFQRARLEQLRALRTYAAASGTPLGVYLWRAARTGARREVMKAGAPVSTEHRLDALRGLRAVPLAGGASLGSADGDAGERFEAATPAVEEAAARWRSLPDPTRRNAPEPLPDPDSIEAVEARAWAEAVRARLAVVLGVNGAAFALDVLGGRWSCAAVADAHRVSLHRVYKVRNEARRAIACDPVLAELWSVHTPWGASAGDETDDEDDEDDRKPTEDEKENPDDDDQP